MILNVSEEEMNDRNDKNLSNLQSQTTQPFTPPPITFIWFGPQVPQDYMIRLSTLPYPTQFLKNPPINHKFSRTLKQIQKADYYRLEYIYQNGGIYSDFDNKIDFQCLKRVLASYKDLQKVLFWWQPKRNSESRNVVPNSFIFAPKAKMEAMKKILRNVDENQKDLKFAGMEYLNQFANKELIQVKELYECIQHEYDFSWVGQSGSGSSPQMKRKEKQQLTEKKKKKSQIIDELEETQQQNAYLKRQYDILLDKYQMTNEKLMKEYRRRYVKDEEDIDKNEINQEKIPANLKEYVSKSKLTRESINQDSIQNINRPYSMKSQSISSKPQIDQITQSKDQDQTEQKENEHIYQDDQGKNNNFYSQSYLNNQFYGTPPQNYYSFKNFQQQPSQYIGPQNKFFPFSPEAYKLETVQNLDEKNVLMMQLIVGLVISLLCLIIIFVIKVQKQKYRSLVINYDRVDAKMNGLRMRFVQNVQSQSFKEMPSKKASIQSEINMNEDEELSDLKDRSDQ